MSYFKKKLVLVCWLACNLFGCSQEGGIEYVEGGKIRYFYSVVKQYDGSLKMIMDPTSVPAIVNYKNSDEQVIILKPGGKVKISLDEEKVYIYEFEFVKYENGMIYGVEAFHKGSLSDENKVRIKLKEYPKFHLENN